ncbi:MAG: substrate-binding domain-containing protein [Candidatus Marinimicrobia bacterium]|nr:substrate-binding domain-containing protein [Candidatus Neomarinimicrobiota bacterium]
MNISANNGEPQYKKDPVYRYTSIIVPALMAVTILLLFWYSKDQILVEEPRTITVYCFSAMEPVMEQGILPAFQDYWEKHHDERVEFITTFAGSGVVTKQIMTKLPVEIAILSSELDARRLLSRGIITNSDWQELHERDKLCRTPVVLFVRDSNQASIKSFDEIDYDALSISIPDPLTSGVGQMVAIAIYGSYLRNGYSHNQALESLIVDYSRAQYHPTTSQGAMELFHAGLGDISINYEAARAYHQGISDVTIVYPDVMLVAEPVIVAIKRNIDPDQVEITSAFLDFMQSKDIQLQLSVYGFQTINTSEEPGFVQAPKKDIFTLDSLGTANELNRSIIDKLLTRK